MHRVTGIALSIGTLLLIWWLVAAATIATTRSTGCSGSSARRSACFCCSAGPWRCSIHFFTGIRHLAWDAGYGFDKPLVHVDRLGGGDRHGRSTLLIWVVGLRCGEDRMRTRTKLPRPAHRRPALAAWARARPRLGQVGRRRTGGRSASPRIALVPLTLWFICAVIRLSGASHDDVAHWVASPVTDRAADRAGASTTFHHMQLGLQVVIEDYVHDDSVTLALLLSMKAVCVLLALACIVVGAAGLASLADRDGTADERDHHAFVAAPTT